MRVTPLAMTGRLACHTLAHPGLSMKDPGMNSSNQTWTPKDAKGRTARGPRSPERQIRPGGQGQRQGKGEGQAWQKSTGR